METLPARFFEDLAQPPLCGDPHGAFDALRDMRMPRLESGEIVLVHHADVRAALNDRRFHKPALLAPPGVLSVLTQMFIILDGADHRRLRRVVSPLFSPAAVALRLDGLRAEATQILAGQTTLDAAADYADQLPYHLTSRWLGVDAKDHAAVRRASKEITDQIDAPIPTTTRQTLRYVRAMFTRRARPIAFTRATSTLVRMARQRFEMADRGDIAPGAIFLQALQDGRTEAVIDDDEAIATWILLLIAGYETTALLIGTAMHHLLERPDVLESVRNDPNRISAVIEETLRFNGPVPITARVASEDIELPIGLIRANDTVILAMIAANRDPEVFDDPNRFNIDRDTADHLGFAHGAHFCVGANLARAEANAGIASLLERDPTPNGEANWRQSFGNRGISQLPVTLRR